MGAYEASLVDAVRDRESGMSAVTALTEFLVRPQHDRLSSQDSESLATMARMITASPALLARERQVFAEHTAELAGVLAEQTHAHPEDLAPWVVANVLMGVHRAILDSVRRTAMDGQPNPGLARDVRFQAERALALLEKGLDGYPENDQRPRRGGRGR